MPNELIAKIEQKHNIEHSTNPDYAAVWWHIDDVHFIAKDLGVTLTNEEARTILQGVVRSHDACYGITWETISSRIDMFNSNKGAR